MLREAELGEEQGVKLLFLSTFSKMQKMHLLENLKGQPIFKDVTFT